MILSRARMTQRDMGRPEDQNTVEHGTLSGRPSTGGFNEEMDGTLAMDAILDGAE